MKLTLRLMTLMTGIILCWMIVVQAFHLPPYILPGPMQVGAALMQNFMLILQQSVPTLTEIILGFLCGTLLGMSMALGMVYLSPLRFWFLPVLLISQALPTFAIAPLFIIWLGYGMSSKIAITVLMLFFPITSSFYDGLRSTPQSYLELASNMQASKIGTLWFIQLPHALPSLATGLRVAAVIAPAGAIIGEWVGASEGLGFLLLNANARLQIDLMFAVLVVMTCLTMLLYFIVDRVLKRFINW